ncbi:bifunctional peptidase and (3S)-lysyl hydroxylase Jmjd7 [Microplitis mediator]|uniref:bifunctional peptidase and (3S)-lysyl hydroxylase Jmjd7 n=1 Tax=Microplitis mediator TaxID=375433 RepID=UPI0025532859|nr:bifunctional peptidase and (3S)-lysyl hydroxylase Jmjd7 [Microplitis mediator]XP_057330277.1 bifunctional peptidase and (3S)-lysyl hydroxylase Jmjd7 [Microplitis mediator]
MENFEKDKINKAFQILSQEAKDLYLSEEIATINVEHIAINPLKFYRDYVSRNVPVLVKNGVSKWPAINKWNANYFRKLLSDKLVTVAVTPNGYADAVMSDNNKKYFMLPEEREMKMSSFLDKLDNPIDDEIYYIQQQNSNFENYFYELWQDIDNLVWANDVFGKNPDAINFWMGDKRAVTSMHKDPYENIYCVVNGEKIFILHPPTDLPWIPYDKYPSAVYKKQSNNKWDIIANEKINLSTCLDNIDNENLIPWISIDPLNPNYEKYPEYKNATTIKVKVEAGDLLYLPSLWFHHVQQSHECIAINFWYDMEYDIKYAYFKSIEFLCQ